MTNFKHSFCSAASYFGTIYIFCEVRDNTCNTKGLRCDDRWLDLNPHLLYRKITAHHLIKLLVERYICDKAHFLPLPGQKLQRGNAKGRIAACSRYGKLLTNDTIDIHNSHPILLCYITKRIDNKWKLL